ncbi:hypothetical protein PENSTE_c040G10410 [Penicillium steckii]|uniref:Uncharacterized protein n=1 Tax=Penicillium steckii TaxID=303698 RepID=A0A1V6SJQ0_9EURO|nr:hypothetical protein PENSTE_c040G10410 [Penicillium steckii]
MFEDSVISSQMTAWHKFILTSFSENWRSRYASLVIFIAALD